MSRIYFFFRALIGYDLEAWAYSIWVSIHSAPVIAAEKTLLPGIRVSSFLAYWALAQVRC